jgi:hypothetical protein
VDFIPSHSSVRRARARPRRGLGSHDEMKPPSSPPKAEASVRIQSTARNDPVNMPASFLLNAVGEAPNPIALDQAVEEAFVDIGAVSTYTDSKRGWIADLCR